MKKTILLFALAVVMASTFSACKEPVGVDTPNAGTQPKLSPAADDGTPKVQIIQ